LHWRSNGFFDLHKERIIFLLWKKNQEYRYDVPSLHDPFIYEIAPYFQKAFSSIGIGFSIITKDPDDQRYSRLMGAFRKFYSGLILVGEAADELTIRTLRMPDYPIVLLEKTTNTLD